MLALDSTPHATPAGDALPVGIGQRAVTSDQSALLVSYGLGSCVAVAMWDAQARVGGLIHVLLPDPPAGASPATLGRFAATGVPLLLFDLEAAGASRTRLRVVAAGGARMLGALSRMGPVTGIGERNVLATRAAIEAAGLRLAACDFGGTTGRTLGLTIATGATWTRVAGGQPRDL